MPSSKPLIYIYVQEPYLPIANAECIFSLLNSTGLYDVKYIGPGSYPSLPLTSQNLAGAAAIIFGGGEGTEKFNTDMITTKQVIRDYVTAGGRYIGFCMGAYLITSPGYQFITAADNIKMNVERQMPNAQISKYWPGWLTVTMGTSAVPVSNSDLTSYNKDVYFQDGCSWSPIDSTKPMNCTILGRFRGSNTACAIIKTFGSGKVLGIGPHFEAPAWWFYTEPQRTKIIQSNPKHDITGLWKTLPPVNHPFLVTTIQNFLA